MKGKFEGWYYKQQANGQTLALIPGRAQNRAFIMVVTDRETFHIPFRLTEYQKKGGILQIGDNRFSATEIILKINRRQLSLAGELSFTGLTPIKGDIMGPFRFFPMECRHSVISMKHEVSGEVTLNRQILRFEKGTGYLESDRGTSFPVRYTWVQGNDFAENCSIMISVARIPFCGFHFTGCIGVVWHGGKEYRLATYQGVKILCCRPGILRLAQGKYRLTITLSSHRRTAHPLAAPKSGRMNRIIKENPACTAEFVFTREGRIIFRGVSHGTSYEYVS